LIKSATARYTICVTVYRMNHWSKNSSHQWTKFYQNWCRTFWVNLCTDRETGVEHNAM